MSKIDRTPRSLEQFWSSEQGQEDPQPELQRPSAGYSSYGPQRMSGCGAIQRRNPRQGVSDFVTLSGAGDMPDQSKSAAELAKEWVGGSVTLAKGDWGYAGPDPVTVKIAEITPNVDQPTFPTIKVIPEIPTNAYPGGTNFFSMFSMVGGKWSRPGIMTKIANTVGVSETVVGLAALAAGAGLLWWSAKPTATRRSLRVA